MVHRNSNIWHTWHTHPGRRGVKTRGELALLRSGGLSRLLPEDLVLLPQGVLALLMPGLEARRAMPGPQTLWLAQDFLLWLAWDALPWLARLALLRELEAHVQAGGVADGRRSKRSCSRSWLEMTVSGGQPASRGPQPRSPHGDGPPVRKGPAPVRYLSSSPMMRAAEI